MSKDERMDFEARAVLNHRVDVGLETRVMGLDDERLPELLRRVAGRLGVGEAVPWVWDEGHVAILVRAGRGKVLALVMDPGAANFLVSRLASSLCDHHQLATARLPG